MLGAILTAIVTPFRDDGSVDLETFRRLARHLVENGSDGIVVTGTTGEAPTLSDDERLQLYAAAVDELEGEATVIAGTGTYATAHSVHLTRRAHEVGVDGFLVVTPYYNKPPLRGILAHVRAIADATDRPIVYYNIPARVGQDVPPDALTQIAEIPNVVAVKQANDDLEKARRIVEETGLALYAGDDNLVQPFLELGGAGGVCVHTHVVGPQVAEQARLVRAREIEAARRIHAQLAPVYELLRVVTNPIAIKAALGLLGWDVGAHRLPLVRATEDETAQVRDCLERLGVLEPAAA